MPANLTPDYLSAEEKYKAARSMEEKIAALEEMLAKIPKHKGTEKLQADIKSKLAKFKKQTEKKGGGPARRKETYHITREGAGKVVLVGAPNTGKSKLFVTLTNAKSEVQDYPFTTRKPVPGMMTFEDITIQLVDLPPLSREFMESWVPQVVRLADIVLFMIDAAAVDPLGQIEEPIEILREKKIELVARDAAPPGEDAEHQSSIAYLKTIVAANYIDVDGARDMLELIESEASLAFDVVPISAESGEGLDDMKRMIYDTLNIDRVYSKQPGKNHSPVPFVMRKGSTVIAFAEKVHKDFVEKFQFAR
ncbi:MAG: GTPase, partial [Pseudomonadota bacterium]